MSCIIINEMKKEKKVKLESLEENGKEKKFSLI